MFEHLWLAAKLAFAACCATGALLFVLWLAAVAVSARAGVSRPHRHARCYRVGGAVRP